MNSTPDLQTLQRLVDGELDQSQRCKFLAEIDASPDMWRDVALAFVEQQIWQQEIGALGAVEATFEPRRQNVPAPLSASKVHSNVRLSRIVRIAVSVLIILGVGYGLGRLSGVEQSPPEQIVQQKPPATPEIAPVIAEPQPAFHIRLVSEGGNSDRVVEIPVYESEQIGQLSPAEPDTKAITEFNRKYGSQGYQASWHTEYLTADLDDDRQVIVPIRSLQAHYSGL